MPPIINVIIQPDQQIAQRLNKLHNLQFWTGINSISFELLQICDVLADCFFTGERFLLLDFMFNIDKKNILDGKSILTVNFYGLSVAIIPMHVEKSKIKKTTNILRMYFWHW